MNKDRRKQIAVEQADVAKAVEAINDAIGNLENIRDDEEEHYDNLPENLSGEKGDRRAQRGDRRAPDPC